MGRSGDDHHSRYSSVDSSSHLFSPSSSSSSDSCFDECVKNGFSKCGSRRLDLSTDLKLGLTLPFSCNDDRHAYNSSTLASSSTKREKEISDWPPIKPQLRSTLTEKSYHGNHASLFMKVYMEGIPIGRKLDLYALEGYEALLATLCRMFKTKILCSEDADCVQSGEQYVLTYEDKEGDWMMVGDIPWEMFLSTVKRLKITRGDRC